MMKQLHELTILEVAGLYRKKELSPVELVRSLFSRLEELEYSLNSFITITAKEALMAAEKAEGIFLRGEQAHQLCGIPFSVKDLFDTKGIRTTCGSKILQSYIPDRNAALVQQLQEFGAILIGKTNMLEFAYGIVHPDYGQTNNPCDTEKTAGGSSGGSAASVASGIGLFSIGSDTGGSIRIPASYCGIAGLKPTFGLLSLDGVFPLSSSLDHAGPLAKSAEDLRIVMESLAPNLVVQNPAPIEKIKIGILPPQHVSGVEEEVLNVYNQALKQMKAIGWETQEIELQYFARTEELVMNIILPEAALVHEKWLSQKDDYAPLTYKQIEAGLNHHSLDYLRARKNASKAREQVDEVLNLVDVLVMPTVPYPAPDEDPALEIDNEMMFTGLFNVTGHPAVSINAGCSASGLPIGIQLTGRHLEDRRLLEIAAILERELNITGERKM